MYTVLFPSHRRGSTPTQECRWRLLFPPSAVPVTRGYTGRTAGLPTPGILHYLLHRLQQTQAANSSFGKTLTLQGDAFEIWGRRTTPWNNTALKGNWEKQPVIRQEINLCFWKPSVTHSLVLPIMGVQVLIPAQLPALQTLPVLCCSNLCSLADSVLLSRCILLGNCHASAQKQTEQFLHVVYSSIYYVL